MDNIFTPKQEEKLADFVKLIKEAIYTNKIPPAYLIYLLSRYPEKNKQNVYTKVNKVLLRDTLPKRKRLYLDYIARNN
jgi:hypothetical protein